MKPSTTSSSLSATTKMPRRSHSKATSRPRSIHSRPSRASSSQSVRSYSSASPGSVSSRSGAAAGAGGGVSTRSTAHSAHFVTLARYSAPQLGHHLVSAIESLPDRMGRRFHLGGVGVLGARPEEATQAILLVARHHMHMEMRDALTHDVVLGDERALRRHTVLHCCRQSLDLSEEGGNQLGIDVAECLDVCARDQQRVTGKERTVVE